MAFDKKIGSWAFIIGVALAIIAGLIAIPNAALILAILGLIVGFLNITVRETTEFLVASIALILLGAAGLSAIAIVGPIIAAILANIAAFVAPAALVVAIKAIYALAKA